MAKITGKDQVLVFDDVTLTCITSVEYSEGADAYTAPCNGAAAKSHIVGQNNITVTINTLLESTATTQITTFNPGTDSVANSATIDWQHDFTNTSGDIRVTSTRGVVLSRNVSVPVEGMVSLTATIGLDDITWTTTP